MVGYKMISQSSHWQSPYTPCLFHPPHVPGKWTCVLIVFGWNKPQWDLPQLWIQAPTLRNKLAWTQEFPRIGAGLLAVFFLQSTVSSECEYVEATPNQSVLIYPDFPTSFLKNWRVDMSLRQKSPRSTAIFNSNIWNFLLVPFDLKYPGPGLGKGSKTKTGNLWSGWTVGGVM